MGTVRFEEHGKGRSVVKCSKTEPPYCNDCPNSKYQYVKGEYDDPPKEKPINPYPSGGS